MPATFNKQKLKGKIRIANLNSSSLGLVIPFQPSMWKDLSTQTIYNYASGLVLKQLNEKAGVENLDNFLGRLKTIFIKLNFNSHRKSLALILSPEEDKMIYLDFQVKPYVCLGETIYFLDLIADVEWEPDFYLLQVQEKRVQLFQYNQNHLIKIFEQVHDDDAYADLNIKNELFQNAAYIIKLMNGKNNKPVFITGSAQQIEAFNKIAPHPEIIFKKIRTGEIFFGEIIESLISEITEEWHHWQSEFFSGKILIAHKTNSFISNIDAVLQSLTKKADGFLLMDKQFKLQLHNPKKSSRIFSVANEFINEVEKFLVRGNKIEITKTGLLKDMGGVVLLRSVSTGSSKGISYNRQSLIKGMENLF